MWGKDKFRTLSGKKENWNHAQEWRTFLHALMIVPPVFKLNRNSKRKLLNTRQRIGFSTSNAWGKAKLALKDRSL